MNFSHDGPLARARIFLLLIAAMLLLPACQAVQPDASSTPSGTAAAASEGGETLVVYSGRSENLVDPLIQQFAEETGIDVDVRYGGTSELAATIMEEGQNSPADVFFGQDAGALGALAKAGRLSVLPDEILAAVPEGLHSASGDWVGISGRARVLVYNTDELTEADLPPTIWGLTDETWQGRVGWAPTNGSFQAFVTALRVLEGEERAREWLEVMIANDTQVYPNNSAIVEAAAAGEISVGLVNHYYLYRYLAEQGEDFPARNYYFPEANAGSMINVAGVGILNTAQHTEAAQRFIEYLLGQEAQQFFADETFEYPLVSADIEVPDILVPLSEIATPEIDLSDLDDLEGTLQLLQEVGALD